MARGKQTCKILKEIRRQIAEANDIEFVTSECRYKGDCLGTCPKCEAEVRYLEQQLCARSLAGKAVALAGISAGMILMSGCSETSTKNQADNVLLGEVMESPEMVKETDDTEEGEVQAEEDTTIVTNGEVALPPEEIPKVGEVIDESNSFFDEEPVFPGGMKALMQFLVSNLKYPEEWNETCIVGKVIAKLEIDEYGKIGNVEIVLCTVPKDFSDSAIMEVKRVVKLLPDFIPAQKDGNSVKSYYILPISFKLADYDDYCD